MSTEPFVVRVAFDEDAQVWFIAESNVAGLTGEADSLDALLARLPALVSDMLQENYRATGPATVEVIASRHIRVREAA